MQYLPEQGYGLCTFKQGHDESDAEKDVVVGADAGRPGNGIMSVPDTDPDSADVDVGGRAQVKYADE